MLEKYKNLPTVNCWRNASLQIVCGAANVDVEKGEQLPH